MVPRYCTKISYKFSASSLNAWLEKRIQCLSFSCPLSNFTSYIPTSFFLGIYLTLIPCLLFCLRAAPLNYRSKSSRLLLEIFGTSIFIWVLFSLLYWWCLASNIIFLVAESWDKSITCKIGAYGIEPQSSLYFRSNRWDLRACEAILCIIIFSLRDWALFVTWVDL